MSNPISSESSALLLEKLCCALVSSSARPPSSGQLSIQNLVSPSPLLASLIRAACFIDLAASRREISTQTDSCLLKSKTHHHLSPLLSSLSRHRDERSEERRQQKKRKRKKEESKPRKKKKKEKRKVHYCSSPSYSDFEPEDPILRRRLR